MQQKKARSFLSKLKIHRRILLVRFFFTKVPFSVFWKISAILGLITLSITSNYDATASKIALEAAPPPSNYTVSLVVKPMPEEIQPAPVALPVELEPSKTISAAETNPNESFEKWIGHNREEEIKVQENAEKLPPTINSKVSDLITVRTEKDEEAAAMVQSKQELEKDVLKTLAKIPDTVSSEGRINENKNSFTIDRAAPANNLPEESLQPIDKTYDEDVGIRVEVKKSQPKTALLYEQAMEALEAEQYEVAISLFKELHEKRPFDENALFGLAVAYQKNLQREQAKDAYEQLLKINKKSANAINNYLALVGEEAPLSAIEEFKQLQKANPEFAAIPAQIAMLYLKIDKLSEAAEFMSHAVTLEPTNVQYIYNLAIIFDKKGNKKFAASLYGQVLDLAAFNSAALPDSADRIRERMSYISSTAEIEPSH